MTENVSKVKDRLGLKARVLQKDGRSFTGVFMAFDYEKNVILSQCEESHFDPDLGASSRYAGLIMIPGSEIVSFQVEDVS